MLSRILDLARTIWVFGWFVISLIRAKFALVKINRLEENNNSPKALSQTNQLVERMSKNLIGSTGSEVKVEGLDKIPEGPVLVISNHQSAFDIPLLTGYLNKGLAYVAKKSLRKVPVIGRLMKSLRCILIDRSDIRQTLRAFQRADEIFSAGQSMVVFPEGTRSQSAELGSFRRGSFKIAFREEVPIVPVAIKDSYKLWEGNDYLIQSAEIKITVADPIYPEELSAEEQDNISNKVRETIEKEV